MNKHKTVLQPLEQRRVLLTRPYAKNIELAQLLLANDIYSHNHSLLKSDMVDALITQESMDSADIIIAVSENAVNFANQQWNAWPQKATYLAIGEATQRCFNAINIDAQFPQEPTTEGLLKLSCLTDVKHKNIIIMRGNGGRETLANSLAERGANVRYFEVYQRYLTPITPNLCALEWQQHQINIIVVTSGEILQHIYTNIGEKALSWLQSLWLVVPSERIATIARQLGAKQVSVSHGADNESILKILLQK